MCRAGDDLCPKHDVSETFGRLGLRQFGVRGKLDRASVEVELRDSSSGVKTATNQKVRDDQTHLRPIVMRVRNGCGSSASPGREITHEAGHPK